jgi:hypothetical protein
VLYLNLQKVLLKAYDPNDHLDLLHLLLRASGAPGKAFSGDLYL